MIENVSLGPDAPSTPSPRSFSYLRPLLLSVICVFALVACEAHQNTQIVDTALYRQEAVCPLHGTLMPRGIVPIEYGYEALVPPDRYREAEAKLFPNAHDMLPGGCIRNSATHARIRFCPECRRDKKIWLAAHPEYVESG